MSVKGLQASLKYKSKIRKTKLLLFVMWTPENRARVAEMTSQEAGQSPTSSELRGQENLSPDSPALSVSSTHHAPQFRVSRSFLSSRACGSPNEMQWECLAEYN